LTGPAAHVGKPIPVAAGIGLRGEHYRRIDEERPDIGWLEVHTENYFGRGGVPHLYLERLRGHYPISFHGVGLSLGSTDPIDESHLDRIIELAEHYAPALVSEHLSWGSVSGVHLNDLLPLPYTRESLDHLTRRIDHVQSRLARPILIENPSTYLEFAENDFAETEFMNTLSDRTGCGILLDVNNVYVCAVNHGFPARRYLDDIDGGRVGEIHLAGHVVNRTEYGDLLIDSHDRPVCDEVWDLYRYAIDRVGPAPTLIEWDTDLPELETLLDLARTAGKILAARNAVAA
jgi:uncharacterized protein (UPF0276 family)